MIISKVSVQNLYFQSLHSNRPYYCTILAMGNFDCWGLVAFVTSLVITHFKLVTGHEKLVTGHVKLVKG